MRPTVAVIALVALSAACGDSNTGDVPLSASTTVAPTTAAPLLEELDTDEGVTEMPDGDNLVFIVDVPDAATLEVDLAVWFSGDAANDAAAEDGVSEIPVPNDYYIRNADPATMTVPVSPDVAVSSVWFGYDDGGTLENEPITYDDFLAAMRGEVGGAAGNLRTSPWWVIVSGGEIVALDEQYRP